MNNLTIINTGTNLYDIEHQEELAQNVYAENLQTLLDKALAMFQLYKDDFTLTLSYDEYDADYNDDLKGYVLTFRSGKQAQTQYDIENNKLSADFGRNLLNRYTEYDDDLSIEESLQVDEFVNVMK